MLTCLNSSRKQETGVTYLMDYSLLYKEYIPIITTEDNILSITITNING